MEYQKITNLLGNTPDKVPRFITKKWVEVHDQSGTAENRYKPSKQIRFQSSKLRPDFRYYSDGYIVVKRTIIVTNPNNDAYDKKLAFKNNSSFDSYITKINNTLIDHAEDLDILMPMYNLIEYSRNYRKTTGNLWKYYRDETNSGFEVEGNNRINYSIKNSKSFDYKTSITGKLEGGNVEKDRVKIAVPLKYLSKLWRTLDMPLINSEVSLTLTLSENCVITSRAYREEADDDNPIDGINNPTNATFKITDCKLYVSTVTLKNHFFLTVSNHII